MKAKPVPSAWLHRDGRRLDCGPYMSGALEAHVKLERLRTVPLQRLTRGGLDGIFHAGRIKRLWVNDTQHGRPFLSSTEILQADFSNLSLIAHKSIAENPKLPISQGWTLITRSGTVGRMAYARPDMEGLACSEHVMRVVPDPGKIPPGYLYAYLSSKFGVPLIVGGTYGAIIQHIEPEHIATLPVPRFAPAMEKMAHDLVTEAANLRAEAASTLRDAVSNLERDIGAPQAIIPTDKSWHGHGVASNLLGKGRRLDGFFYNPMALAADEWAAHHPRGCWLLGDVADVFDVPPFKHIYVDAEHGVPFFTSGDLFFLERRADKYLSRSRTKGLHKYVVKSGWLLLARSGQLGGILGRPQFADSAMDNATASDHVIRIVPRKGQPVPAGYLYAYLASALGYVFLTRTMAGKSIPALWPTYLQRLPVVKAGRELMADAHKRVVHAFEQRVQATTYEDEARRLVEDAVTGKN